MNNETDSIKIPKSENKNEYILTITIIISSILVIMALMFLIYSGFYKKAHKMAVDLAVDEVRIASEITEATLKKAIHVVDTTANGIEYLIEQGASNSELLHYITRLSTLSTQNIDKNYTGLFGFFRGEYLDGTDWTPDKDFVPTQRPWYIGAKQAGGDTTIIAPYLDKNTGTVIVSASKMLSDKSSVLSLDIELNDISSFADNLEYYGTEYIFIVDKTGYIISSKNHEDIGKNYLTDDSIHNPALKNLFLQAFVNNSFEQKFFNQKYIVFTSKVIGGWRVIVAVNQSEVLGWSNRIAIIGFILIFLLGLIISYYVFRIFLSNKQRRQEEQNALELSLEHEKQLQNDYDIITSLAGQFDYVALLNIVHNTMKGYRVGGIFSKYLSTSDDYTETNVFDDVIRKLVPPENLDNFLKIANKNQVLSALQKNLDYSFVTTLYDDEKSYKYKFIFSKSSKTYTNIILGIKNVTNE